MAQSNAKRAVLDALAPMMTVLRREYVLYFLFVKPSFEPASPVDLFRGVFATIEAAQAQATLGEYEAEVVSFDGERLVLVSEYPVWRRMPKGQIPIGRLDNEWGLSDS